MIQAVPVQSSMHVKAPQKVSSSLDTSCVTSIFSLPLPGMHVVIIGLPNVLQFTQSRLSAMLRRDSGKGIFSDVGCPRANIPYSV